MSARLNKSLAAVPAECKFSLKWLGFDKVPQSEQMQWLKARFFRPAGWAGIEDFAAVKGVRRIRKYCWRAIAPLVTEQVLRDRNARARRHSLADVARGRPSLRRAKLFALQLLVHEPGKAIPVSWQWPLVEIAITSDLPPEESLWLLTRFTVLPDKIARLCALEVANTGARLVSYAADQAFARYAALVRSGTFTETYCGGARALLCGSAGVPCVDEHILNAFEAVSSREPCFALRRAIAHAGMACLGAGCARDKFLGDFREAVRSVVLHEMF